MKNREAIVVLENEKKCVNRKIAENCSNCELCDLVMADADIIGALNMAVSALESQSGWIPCSERFPGETDEYWVTVIRDDERIVEPRAFFPYEKRWGQGRKPIAWMTRPEPYQGEA